MYINVYINNVFVGNSFSHLLKYVNLFYLADNAQNGAIVLFLNGYISSSFYYGIVRVYYNNGWGNICDNYYYSSTEANVVCHQLGFTGASSYSRAGLMRLELINLSQVLNISV